MDSRDFIPSDGEIEVLAAYFTEDVANHAGDEELEKNVKGAIRRFEDRFSSQMSPWRKAGEGIWSLCDWAFRCCMDDAKAQSEKVVGANVPKVWERAKTGTTQFYRQVSQKAANGYAVQTSKDMPFRYEPLNDGGIESPDHAAERSKKMNLCAKWAMKADKFSQKSIDFWTQVYKYGNIPVMVEWVQRIGKKKVAVPVYGEDGMTLDEYEITELDGQVVENRPTVAILPVESLLTDPAIGNIQDQDCVIVTTVVGINQIVNGVRTGIYRDDLVEKLTKAHQWDGTSGREDSKESNRGVDFYSGTGESGQYLKREVFVNLPVDAEGKWDEKKNIPERYRVTLIGNTPETSLVARIERNQEPDDAIPIEVIHANPDDPDILFHISPFEVVRSNMSTETTLIRQIVDNNTLVNYPPMWEVEGQVRGNDRTFGPTARYVVDDSNSLGFVPVRDVSQPSLQVLDYIKEDSNTANSIDKNMAGESFGARTSAQEASTISSNSQRPNLVNIEYIMQQFLGFYASRVKVLFEAYARKEQVVQITDSNEHTVYVKPAEIDGEFDVVVDIVDEIKEDEVKAQRMINYAQVVSTGPMAQTIDWVSFSRDLAERLMGTSKYIVGGNTGDADAMARMNIAAMLNNGQFPQMSDGMNLDRHLEIYKAERTRWNGREESNPNVEILDAVIAQVEQHIQSAQGGQAPGMAAPQSGSMMGGQQISEAFGGVQ
jgi:hypothetical protein